MGALNRRALVVLVAALALAALTARLGIWQLDRAAQKTALQRSLDERRALPPLPAAGWPARRPRRRRSTTAWSRCRAAGCRRPPSTWTTGR
jgi:cytochrome oxidase assembly protein ShyY1